jgi:predicted small integral membrane protein
MDILYSILAWAFVAIVVFCGIGFLLSGVAEIFTDAVEAGRPAQKPRIRITIIHRTKS